MNKKQIIRLRQDVAEEIYGHDGKKVVIDGESIMAGYLPTCEFSLTKTVEVIVPCLYGKKDDVYNYIHIKKIERGVAHTACISSQQLKFYENIMSDKGFKLMNIASEFNSKEDKSIILVFGYE